MVDLLAKLQSHQLVQRFDGSVAQDHDRLSNRTATAQSRITAGLVDRSRLAPVQRVGIGTATNDVGVINSPQGRRVAIAVSLPVPK